nr:hypothetical protein [uncultured Anaeromusa sp.]
MFKKTVTSGLVVLAMLPIIANGEAAAPGTAADAAAAKILVQHQTLQGSLEESHQRAIELSRAGKMNEALVLLQELSQHPESGDAIWYDYLTVLQWAGNNKATIELFQQRYGGKEDAVPGFVLRSLGGAYYQLEEFEKSQRYYTLAVAKGELPSRLQLAEAAMRSGDVTTGQAIYVSLLKETPDNGAVYLSRSNMALYRKDFLQSQTDYRKALELMASESDSEKRRDFDAERAAVLIRTDELQQAILLLQPYMSGGKGNKRMECDYILALRLRGDYKQAIVEATRLWPDLGDVPTYGLQALGDSYLRLDQYEKADAVYAVLLKREPTRVAAYLGQAYGLTARGRVSEGVALYRKTYALDAAAVSRVIAIDANSFFIEGRYAAGKALYELLLELEPNKASHYREYGNNLSRTEMPREAYGVFRRLASLPEGELYGLSGEVKAAVAAGDYQSAQKALVQLQERHSRHALTAEAVRVYDTRKIGEATTGFTSFSDYKGNDRRIWEHSGSHSLGGSNWDVLWATGFERVADDVDVSRINTQSIGLGYRDRWWSTRLWGSSFTGEGNRMNGLRWENTLYFRDYTYMTFAMGRRPLMDAQAWRNGAMGDSFRSVSMTHRVGPRDTYTLGYEWSGYTDSNRYSSLTADYTHNVYATDKKTLSWFLFFNRSRYNFESDLYESPAARVGYGGGFFQRWEIPKGYWALTSALGWGYDKPDPTDFAPYFRLEYGHDFSAQHSLVIGFEYGLRSNRAGNVRDSIFSYRQFDIRYNVLW